MRCNVCHTSFTQAVYQSSSEHVLTSLCEVKRGRTSVFSCAKCGHIQTAQMLDAKHYYAQDYKILLSHDDEDQIYSTNSGKIVYRTQHQLATLKNKIALPSGAKILDYGCAKATMPLLLLQSQPNLEIYLFDVSDMYLEHWRRFLPPSRWAIHEIPVEWENSFDLVTSFFAFEHIDDPVDGMKTIARLLRTGGRFYGIVPDTVGNVADYIVIDHVNHFTESSLRYALHTAGLHTVSLDRDAHRGAFVFVAEKTSQDKPVEFISDVATSQDKAENLAAYWSEMDRHLSRAKHLNSDKIVAIYGSGFYGSYIACALAGHAKLSCFLDASPYQQGKTVLNLPVYAPELLPHDVQVLYVGLNPVIARQVMSEQSWLSSRDIELVYLSEDH
jgi:SAM-dependent methyltransferase